MGLKKKNFWTKLKKDFLALAPMAGVTDLPFRIICQQYGADVVYSEMASAAALYYDKKKRKNLKDSPTLDLLKTIPEEKNYVVQLFGSNPDHFAVATKIITEYGVPSSQRSDLWETRGRTSGRAKPAGIDINFGCPVKKVQKQGAGAVLMANKKLSREVIKAVIDNTDLPVSIKTRVKVGDVELLEFLDYIRDLDIKALMIHGRTLNQMFSGPIDTGVIDKAKNYFGGVIMVNGGIFELADILALKKSLKVNGYGLARGVMGKPWLFEEIRKNKEKEISKKDLFKIIINHSKLVEKHLGDKGILELRKHLAWYVKGLPSARELRQKLIKVNGLEDILSILS